MDFSQQEREAISAGAAFTAGHLMEQEPYIVWDLPHEGQASGAFCIRRGATGSPGTAAVAGPDGMTIDADKAVSMDHLESISAHEWGHYWGLVHVSDPPGSWSLMNKSAPAKVTWTTIDQAMCEKEKVCK